MHDDVRNLQDELIELIESREGWSVQNTELQDEELHDGERELYIKISGLRIIRNDKHRIDDDEVLH